MAATASTEKPVTQVTAENPIINKPFEEPQHHWEFGEGAPRKVEGRREAGYIPPAPKGETQLRVADELVRLDHVNRIRARVRDWRERDYDGASQITNALFRHWFDPERERRLFFAQREAIETIAFLTEAPGSLTEGVREIPKAPEPYERWAVKLATGGGKTLVMAMTIAWSGLNKVASKQDRRFADAFLVVCPNLTVKERLLGEDGVDPAHPDSAFEGFGLIPGQFEGMLGQLKVVVTNWHALAEKEDSKYRVLKRGRESDPAYCRRVLGELGSKRRLMVFNDEAHHAWRPPPGLKAKGEEKKELEEATVWVSGLERIHREREILRAIDFSATPMYPGAVGGEKAWTPFEWIISDFGLVDAIESGIVKIPRIPTTDDSGTAVPKYRNLWEHVKKAAPKRGDDTEDDAHPMHAYLAEIDGPLKQLAGEWFETFERWAHTRAIPPAMIVVCAETKMARILERHIAERGEAGPWLQNRDGENYTVRIDSDLLDSAEARLEGESASDAAERLRELVSTVGREGEPGEQVRCLISVGMLSEGWDARNVTQILGLRAFQSQLLCEQVIGRGLRRSDTTDLSNPEYVDVYGVPFQLLPFAKAGTDTPIEPPKTTRVHSLRERKDLRLEFPRVEQIIHDFGEDVTVDLDSIEPILISPENDPTATWVEFEVGEAHSGIGGETQDRSRAYEDFREQRLVFRVAADIVESAGKRHLFAHIARLVRDVVGEKIEFAEGVDRRELCNLRYVQEIRNRTVAAFRATDQDRLIPVLNEYEPIASTDCDFQTVKDCFATNKSHVSHAVCDSKLERDAAGLLEERDEVVAYAKNDRLFLEIPYRHLGTTGRYRPDFIVRLTNGLTLLIETKGRKREKDDAKITAAHQWVEAVNNWGELGQWQFVVARSVAAARSAIEKAAASS